VKFGPEPLARAEGAILAHGLRTPRGRLRKGTVLGPAEIAALGEAGLATVTVARLEEGDLAEDEAAAEVARALAGSGLAIGTAGTGRCNLYATARGLALYERDRLDRCNLIDEAVTVAAIAPFALIEAGDLVATVKIIPLAAPRAAVAAWARAARSPEPLIHLAPLGPKRIGLIQTSLPGTTDRLLDKTRGTIKTRLAALGASLVEETRCAHDEDAVTAAIEAMTGPDLILVLGASATVDRRDVVPTAIERAGGTVEHFGMPVDPGNLTLHARIGARPVLGLPGSARSPRIHGVDWLLQRLLADLPVGREDIMRLGAGGLLKEITARPLPRVRASPPARKRTMARPKRRIAALVLAAGRSRRMGAANKLLCPIDGQPMVARVVAAASASKAAPVVVVTGHERDRVAAALAGAAVELVHNPDYAEGLGGSLKTGVAALDDDIDGVVVCLGDMPEVSAALIDRLIDAFDPDAGHAICVPTHAGRRGNPVLWGRRYFAEIGAISGDVGARHLIGEHADAVVMVACDDPGILLDIDTPEALAALVARE